MEHPLPAPHWSSLLWPADRGAPGRILVVGAHPDDEIIGAGGQLRAWPRAYFLTITDGAPRDLKDACLAGFGSCAEYALARRNELEAALALAGLGPERLVSLAYPDQGASFALGQIVRALQEQIESICPQVVITHPYEGGHPDHDATAFCVHQACELINEHSGQFTGPGEPGPALCSPVVVEMTSYFNRNGSMTTGEFLSPAQRGGADPGERWGRRFLEPPEIALKRRMFDCFVTQQRVLQYFPIKPELFRRAATYDFSAPPHSGTVYYELFDWGMRGEQWRRLAADASEQLRAGGRGYAGGRTLIPAHSTSLTTQPANPLPCH